MSDPVDLSPWRTGDRLRVQMAGDDRWFDAIYLGPASAAVLRPDRDMVIVDDAESWKLIMAASLGAVCHWTPESIHPPTATGGKT